jgi:ubiquitin-small subunit ribosomal protein S27Ae
MTKHTAKKTKEFYKVEGGKLSRTEKVCDRCGSGTFMAEHKDRFYCGKCAMTIWKKKE